MNKKESAEWKNLKKEYWGQDVIVETYEWGYIDFSPQGMKEVSGGEKLTYEGYLDAQMAIGRDIRGWFFYQELKRLIRTSCCLMMICSVRILIRLSVRLVHFVTIVTEECA